MKIEHDDQLDAIDFSGLDGLVPVVTQHATTGEILMLAFTNRAALQRTIEERCMWYWSRSRAALWRKGETSGNVQDLVSLHFDCDADAVLARVRPRGPSCHTGQWSCFSAPPTLAALAQTIEARRAADAASSYTRKLLDDENLRLKKMGEEVIELSVACRDGDAKRISEEAADLLYHVMVACAAEGVSIAELLEVLERRSA